MKRGRPLRVAVIGPISFPAAAGGLTRHCEELYRRLAVRGIDATVYVRSPYMDDHQTAYDGMHLVSLPVPSKRGVETFVYGAVATVRALLGRFDVVHYHGVAAGAFCVLQRLRPGRKLVFTHHRIDWVDEKWGPVATALLRATAWMSLYVSHAVIAVSSSLAEELRSMRDRPVSVIHNGITLPPVGGVEAIAPFSLEPKRYAVVVGRIVPEKGVHVAVEAFDHFGDNDLRLAVVGGPRYSESYLDDVRRRAGPRVVFTGSQSGETLGALYANAAVFVTASTNEGHPIGVLEALGFGLPVVASDIPAHREALAGTDAAFFDPHDPLALASAIRDTLARTHDRAPIDAAQHSWDAVADRTFDVLRELGTP